VQLLWAPLFGVKYVLLGLDSWFGLCEVVIDVVEPV
jgi:hypothetical protein